ncbi:hypothetical protein O8C79_00775 [Aliarcobacter butzleri]|uniref:hypothetical protein n=1 Tax=Aliarcobacter butzleri TaxID=28197 RepID=UPI00263D8480|nr:hypothetical protein [Aliarcobacter butzleri]MDN5103830.1 hypothetical protein [Aliarcobacter butzleri]
MNIDIAVDNMDFNVFEQMDINERKREIMKSFNYVFTDYIHNEEYIKLTIREIELNGVNYDLF